MDAFNGSPKSKRAIKEDDRLEQKLRWFRLVSKVVVYDVMMKSDTRVRDSQLPGVYVHLF